MATARTMLAQHRKSNKFPLLLPDSLDAEAQLMLTIPYHVIW